MKRTLFLRFALAAAASAFAGSAGAAAFAPDPNYAVKAALELPDGDILVGGDFTEAAGAPHFYVARLNADGSGDDAFGAGTNGTVWAIARQPDGKILIGGDFSAVNGVPRRALARLDPDGSLDASFAAPAFAAGPFYAAGVGEIHLQPDGKILVAGSVNGGFTTIDGQSRPGIARLNADGSLDASFVPALDPSDQSAPVFTAAVQADGKIVIGGYMLIGQAQYVLRRLNADGSLDGSFQPGGLDGVVRTVRVQDDGGILAVGQFSTPYPHLVRYHADGRLDASYDAGARLPFAVSTIALQADGRLLVGGSEANGGRVARLNADGSRDASFAEQPLVYVAHALATQADGKVLVGGYFDTIGGYPRRNLARLGADGRVDIPLHGVTPAPGAGGSLSPSTVQAVREGETARFVIQPDAGHRLDSIGGCGGAVQGAYYVTGPIAADCTVTASFAEPEQAFTVTPIASYGSIAPAEPQNVRFGQTASFTLAPSPGYYYSKVSGCDGTLNGSVFTTVPVSADCTLVAEFVAPTGLVATGGSQQSAAVGAPFAAPLAVRVTSQTLWDGRPVAGVTVRFEAPAGGPSAILSSPTAVTDANGEARVTATANATPGGYAVKARVDGIAQPVYFTLGNEAPSGGDLELSVTMSTDPPPACGSATRLDVAAGTPVNYCFTVVNHGPLALNYQTLERWPLHFFWVRDHDHALYLQPVPIAPGGTYRYNKVMAAGTESVDERYAWSALTDLPRYAVDADADEPFVDISATGQALAMNGGTAAVDLPFAWNFYGMPVSPQGGYHLCVNNDGSLVLSLSDNAYCPPYFRGDNGTLGGEFTNGILPYWDALGDNGTVYVQTVGSAPNRRLIVQWQDKDHFTQPNPAGGVTFEAIVEEAGSRVVFVYRDLDFDVPFAPSLNYGGSATIGLYGNDVVHGAFATPPLREGQAIAWTPMLAPHVATAETHLRVGTPRVQATPAAVNASAAAGTRATSTVRIGNAGNLPLEWSLARAPAAAHFPAEPRWIAAVDAQAAGRSPLPDAALGDPARGDASRGALQVPAYGAMLENVAGYPPPNWFVGFDAARVDAFVPVPTTAYEVFAGDFVGDDFTREYVVFRLDVTPFLGVADLVGGGYTPIGEMPEIDLRRWSGMAWDRTTDTLFVANAAYGDHGEPCNAYGGAAGSSLYVVDRRSGKTTPVGEIRFADESPLCVSDIAISPDGQMYGIDLLNDALLAIDKTDGRAAAIGSLGVDLREVNSIDFDDVSGVLYLAAEHFAEFDVPDSGGIYTIDLVTGLARRLAHYPLSRDNRGYLQIDALGIARAGGQCAFPGEIAWLRSDVDAGRTAPGEQSPVALTLDAAGLAAGSYAANVCISSNDRSQPLLAVPVAFTVTAGPGDAIFRNGFEGATR